MLESKECFFSLYLLIESQLLREALTKLTGNSRSAVAVIEHIHSVSSYLKVPVPSRLAHAAHHLLWNP